jgi:hypothetical protein
MATATRRAIYGKLAGDGTLNALLGTPATGYNKSIYHGSAPTGAQYPFVLMNKQDGRPTEAMGDPSALEQDIWLVKAVDRDDTADRSEAISERVKALLNDASLSISGASLLYLRRQSDVEYEEDTDGVVFQHAGSLYRLVTTD